MNPMHEIAAVSGRNGRDTLDRMVSHYLAGRPRVAVSDRLDELHRTRILSHPVVGNSFYVNLLDNRFSEKAIRRFLSEYINGSTGYFYMAIVPQAARRHDHPAWRTYMAHIEEEESTPTPHWVMCNDLLRGFGGRIGIPGAPARRYAEEQMKGYLDDLPFACGYALGVEVQAGFEIAVMYRALNEHHPCRVARTGYFHVHLANDEEEEHSEASVRLIESVVADGGAIERIEAGFMKYLDDVDTFMRDMDVTLQGVEDRFAVQGLIAA